MVWEQARQGELALPPSAVIVRELALMVWERARQGELALPSSAVIVSELARAMLESSPWLYWVKKNWQAEQLSYHPGPPQHLRHL